MNYSKCTPGKLHVKQSHIQNETLASEERKPKWIESCTPQTLQEQCKNRLC